MLNYNVAVLKEPFKMYIGKSSKISLLREILRGILTLKKDFHRKSKLRLQKLDNFIIIVYKARCQNALIIGESIN